MAPVGHLFGARSDRRRRTPDRPLRPRRFAPGLRPDGRLIAYTGNDLTTDTYITRKLYVMNRDGSGSRMISQGFDRQPSGLVWAEDGSGLYMNVRSEGTSNLHFASVDGGVTPVTEGTHMLSGRVD